MMGVCPVLPDVNRLPRSQCELTRHDRNDEARVCHGCSKMSRHVIRTFVVVLVVRAFWRKLSHPAIEVSQNCWICVFLDHQTCRRVLQKERTQARTQVTVRDNRSHEVRHIMQPSASRSNIEQFLMHWMRSTTVSEIEGDPQLRRSQIACFCG
jgi:hypothetical protein